MRPALSLPAARMDARYGLGCSGDDRKRYQGCLPGAAFTSAARLSVTNSSAWRSKPITQARGVLHCRGMVRVPRQVLPPAEAVTFRTSAALGVSSIVAEAISTGLLKPRTRARTEYNCAVPVTTGAANPAQPPSR